MAASLAFEQIGEQGRTLVLVHGWCCRRSHMGALARALSAQYRVFNVDLPGHGETPRFDSAAFASLAEALVGFLEEHDLRDVTLIGHSMGGVLSLMSAPLTDRVSAVVNLDGAFPLTSRALQAYADLFQRVQADGYRPTMEPFLKKAFFLPSEYGPTADALLADMMAAPEDRALALLQQFPHLEPEHTLRTLDRPTLFIGSENPRFDTDVVRSLCPSIQITLLAGVGHFLPVFATDRVADLIRLFLRS